MLAGSVWHWIGSFIDSFKKHKCGDDAVNFIVPMNSKCRAESLFRPTLYPPSLSWISDKPVRISIALQGSGTDSPKTKAKNPSPSKLSVIRHAVSASPMPQRLLTITQTGWGRTKKSQTGEAAADALQGTSEQLQPKLPDVAQLEQ
jgi:hypothetical protein